MKNFLLKWRILPAKISYFQIKKQLIPLTPGRIYFNYSNTSFVTRSCDISDFPVFSESGASHPRALFSRGPHLRIITRFHCRHLHRKHPFARVPPSLLLVVFASPLLTLIFLIYITLRARKKKRIGRYFIFTVDPAGYLAIKNLTLRWRLVLERPLSTYLDNGSNQPFYENNETKILGKVNL